MTKNEIKAYLSLAIQLVREFEIIRANIQDTLYDDEFGTIDRWFDEIRKGECVSADEVMNDLTRKNILADSDVINEGDTITVPEINIWPVGNISISIPTGKNGNLISLIECSPSQNDISLKQECDDVTTTIACVKAKKG